MPAARRLRRKRRGWASSWKALHHVLAVLGFAGEEVGGDFAFPALALEEVEHLDELAEDEDLLALLPAAGSSSSNRVSVLPEAVSLPTSVGWQQIWRRRVRAASTCMRLWARPLVLEGLHDLIAAAAELGEVKLALVLAEIAVAAFLDAVGQVFGDLLLEAAEHEGAELGGEPAAVDALAGGFFAGRLVGFVEMPPVCRGSRAG